MSLSMLISIAQRYRYFIMLGVFLGFVLLMLTRFSMHPDTSNESILPFKLEPRNQQIYRTYIDVMIDDPGFGVGQSGQVSGRRDAFRRTVELAPAYAYMATSDLILSRVEHKLGTISGAVGSNVMEDSPVFRIDVEGKSAKEAIDVAKTIVQTLTEYVQEEQVNSGIQATDRITIRALGNPAAPLVSNSMSLLKSAMAFLSPIIASFILALALENIEREKEGFHMRNTSAVNSES